MPEGRFRSPSADPLLADELLRRLRERGGLTTLLRSAGPELARRYGSTDLFLALRDVVHHTGSLWACSEHSDPEHSSFGYSEPPAAVLDEHFTGPVGDWLLLRDTASLSGDTWRLFLHDSGFVDPPADLIEHYQRLICRRPLTTLISVQIPAVGDWIGRLLIVNAFPDQAVLILSAIAHLAGHVGPAILAKHQQRLLRMLVRAEERAFLARELHDGVIQSLIGLGMRVNVAAQSARPAVARELAAIERELREQVVALRELTEKLRAADFDPSRLLRHFQEMVERFGRDTGIAATFGGDIDEMDITPAACREIVRIVQEALANVRRHSGARSVHVGLCGRGSEWVVEIEDDGNGFPFSGRLTLDDMERTFQGPRVIKERVRALGGELAIESTAQRGARLEIRIPVATRHAVA